MTLNPDATVCKSKVILRSLLVLSLPLLLAGALPASAQDLEPDLQPTAEAAVVEADAPQTPVVSPERASARATMKSFLEGLYLEDYEQAVACLDLSQSGLTEDLREREGRELAVQLKDIIDRTRYVELDEISDRSQDRPYVFLRRAEGEIVIASNEAGEWRFTAKTVTSIPALMKLVEDKEVVAGVKEAPRTPALWLRSKMPDSLRGVGFILEHWQWLGLLFLVVLGFFLDRALIAVLEILVRRYLKGRLVTVDADLLHNSIRPLGLVAMAAVWWMGLFWLGLPIRILQILAVAVKFVIITAVVWSVYRLVDVLTSLLAARAADTESRFDDLLVPLLRKSMKVFVAAFGLVFIADNLELDITGLIAGIGLGGVAVALAAQDTVKNLFGSVTVLADRPFQVGDWVVIGDLEGTVEEVGFRSTRIRTFYNSVITIPNGNLISASVDNMGARAYRRWKAMISLTYDTPPEKIEAFCEGIRELIRRHPCTRKDYFHVYFNQFADSSLNILLYVFFAVPDWSAELQERHRLGLDIVRLAAKIGVEFAFPTQTLYIQRAGEAAPLAKTEGDYGGLVANSLESARDTARSLIDDASPQTLGLSGEGSDN